MALPAAAPADSVRTAPSSSPQIVDTIWSDIKAVGSEALLLITAPGRFGATGWSIAGGALGGTVALTFADDPMRTAMARGHNSTKDRLVDIGNMLGTVPPGAVIVGGLYIGGLLFDAPGVRLAGLHVFQSALYAATITTGAKMLIGRQRPFLNGGPHVFYGPSRPDDRQSLPSGHSTLAFAVCSSLAAEIDNPWATVGLYGAATLTALSRIYSDRHWLSDVFLGAAIGTACGYGVVNLHTGMDGLGGLQLVPMPNGIGALWIF